MFKGHVKICDLKTSRLTLRPCNPADRDNFMALERDPEVMRYLNGGFAVDHDNPPTHDEFLMPRGIETCLWTARKIDDERFVGWFCLWPESEVYAELGYRLQRDTWGLGLATEGSQAIIDWAFESAGYERIAASTMAVNQASRKVMQKLGMRHVRTVPFVGTDVIAGSEEGEVWYEVSRQEWTENRG